MQKTYKIIIMPQIMINFILGGVLTIALIILLGLLVIFISSFSYTDHDKQTNDFISLFTQLIATLIILGGFWSWLLVRNEKAKFAPDPANVRLLAFVGSNSYNINLLLEKESSVYDVVFYTEAKIGEKIKSFTKDYQNFTATNNPVSISLSHNGIHQNDLSNLIIKTTVLYYSDGFYWKIQTPKNAPLRIKPPKKGLGTKGYLTNTTDEASSLSYFADVKISKNGENQLIPQDFSIGEEIVAARKLYQKVRDTLSYAKISDNDIFMGKVWFGNTKEEAIEATDVSMKSGEIIYYAAQFLLNDVVAVRLNAELFKLEKPLIPSYLITESFPNGMQNDEDVMKAFDILNEFYEISKDYNRKMWLPLFGKYQSYFKSDIQNTLSNWGTAVFALIHHNGTKTGVNAFAKEKFNLTDRDLDFLVKFGRDAYLVESDRLNKHERLYTQDVFASVSKDMNNYVPSEAIRELLSWQGD